MQQVIYLHSLIVADLWPADKREAGGNTSYQESWKVVTLQTRYRLILDSSPTALLRVAHILRVFNCHNLEISLFLPKSLDFVVAGRNISISGICIYFE